MLRGIADDRMHDAKMPPASRRVAGLLREFPLCGVKWIFARIDLASGKLEKLLPQRIAILPLHDQLPDVRHRNNDNGTRMDYVFTFCDIAVR